MIEKPKKLLCWLRWTLIGLVLGAIITTIGGFYLNNHSFKNNKYSKQQVLVEDNYKQFKIQEEAIVKEIKDNIQLNILDVYMKQEMTIVGNKNTNLKIFTNNKTIKYSGTAKYYLDFNNLNEKDVIINGNTITIFLNKPTHSISIDQKLTEYKDEKGILTFYDIKVTPEQAYQLEQKAKDNMEEKLVKENFEEEVMKKAEDKISFLIRTITNNNYDTQIVWQ